jgi:DNA gyrase subunit A
MTATDTNEGKIRPIRIEEEMRASYLDYAMSVIVARALPDARDGLKPVQRRILYGMHELGVRPGTPYKKSARIVGEVLGKYHPHGDAPVYEAMVRMAQDFSLRYPLVDGQGNFGSIDGDPPAAMRYTEARLARISQEMLADIERDTVDFAPNFDGSIQEPIPLPARLPNLLVNGGTGIAVGMATSIPPHNLGEVCDAIARLIDEPDTTTAELATIVQGPDFPTGGTIYRLRRDYTTDAEGRRKEVLTDAVKDAYGDGRGRFMVRARARIEEAARGGRVQIIVTELPYQVNKASLIEKIADLARQRRIDGISDLRDESDRHGMRIVIELSRGGQARQVLNALYKHTAMQSSFPVNMLALVDGQPRVINLKGALEQYIHFRREVIRRRSEFDLKKAREREHILQGLLKALQNLDQVIQTIRRAQSAEQAKERLMARPFRLSERQALAVLDMQLRRLARLERQKVEEEFAEVIQQINYLEDLLANPRKIDFLIREDVQDVKKRYGDERRTQIVGRQAEEFSEEDLVAHQEVVVTLSGRGYSKRLPLETYRPQGRGGRGITGMVTREADAVHRLIVSDTHDSLLFFTDRGRVFQLKTYDVPEASRQARGTPLINLVEIAQGELVTAVVAARDFAKDYMVLATAGGEIKKTRLSEFASVRRAGLIAMDLEPEDLLAFARLVHEDDEVILITSEGRALRYAVTRIPTRSRAAGGVRGIRLPAGAQLVGTEVVAPGHELFVITANGFGKRTPFDAYNPHGRGTAGQLTYKTTPGTGPVVAARTVNASQELIVISRDGIVLRTRVETISVQGRSTQGVAVIGVGPGDEVASLATIDMVERPGVAAAAEPEKLPPSRSGKVAGKGKRPTKVAQAAAKKAKATGAARTPRAKPAAQPQKRSRAKAAATAAAKPPQVAQVEKQPRAKAPAKAEAKPSPATARPSRRRRSSYKERWEARAHHAGRGTGPGGRGRSGRSSSR